MIGLTMTTLKSEIEDVIRSQAFDCLVAVFCAVLTGMIYISPFLLISSLTLIKYDTITWFFLKNAGYFGMMVMVWGLGVGYLRHRYANALSEATPKIIFIVIYPPVYWAAFAAFLIFMLTSVFSLYFAMDILTWENW